MLKSLGSPRVARSAAVLMLSMMVPCGAEASAPLVPRPVSPGSPGAGGIVDARCPTFSWAGVPGARGYLLAVFHLPDQAGAEPVLVAQATVPGDARAFTPLVGQCLERGGRYAWSVAASASDGETDPTVELEWSPAFLFEVEAAPSSEELEHALATIQRHLAREAAARPEAGPSAELRAFRGSANDSTRTFTAGQSRAVSTSPRTLSSSDSLSLPAIPQRAASAAQAPVFGDASLTVSRQLHLAAVSDLFKDGDVFLWDDPDGNLGLGRSALASASGSATRNTALGRDALANTTGGAVAGDGASNTAIGDQALLANTTGSRNTAIGARSLHSNTTGGSNFAGGGLALRANTTGSFNTAIGDRALYGTTGDHNLGVGFLAGANSSTGERNIFIGNYGGGSDNETIRIGTQGQQQTAFIAGDLGLGFASGAPQNRLHIRDSIDGSGSVPGNHVAQLENTSSGDSADVLALKVGLDHADGESGSTLGSGINFITFFDGDNTVVGELQGTSTGGIQLVSGNADFAEWLPRLDPTEAMEPGDVVGLEGGALSKSTAHASRVFVVSSGPIVTGNDPGDGRRGGYALVAFLGQVPVKVRGRVRAGDLLVASGLGDGAAIARSHDELSGEDPGGVVGRALESSDADGLGESVRTVRALVGLEGAPESTTLALVRALERVEQRLGRLESEIARGRDAPREAPTPTRRR